MQMKLTHYIYISAALAMLSACKEVIEVDNTIHTVGEIGNAIVLKAGISESGAGVTTRATRAAEDHHTTPGHVAFAASTQLRLKVDGDWWKNGAGSADAITKSTTASIGAIVEGTNDKHKKVTFTSSEQLYWDDYGTADPANVGTGKGREKGLTIYGVAVDGVTSAPAVSNWASVSWNVGNTAGSPATIDQSVAGGWKSKDLLTSNNITAETGADGTLKFDAVLGKDGYVLSNLLEFTHTMSKVTVNLTAGAGFVDSKFVNAPSVTLFGFNYAGNVDVVSKISTPTSGTANIKAFINDGATWVSANTATATALVFPGNTITDSETNYILEVNADGNIYKVSGKKLYDKMASLSHGYVLKQGVNYVINITVNKTGIDVTATIKDWENVEAENETPIINFSTCYGSEGDDFDKDFTFYRSTTKEGNYLTGMTEGNKSEVTYSSGYTMTPSLYWPNHSTHYFFRGIWPKVGSGTPIEKVTTTSGGVTTIAVESGKYAKNTFPSDLMIGMPRNSDGTPDETCKVEAHKTGEVFHEGICATDAPVGSPHANEGLIHMNFQYAMSQVYVELKTSLTGDNVTFNEYTKVEILDSYTSGALKLSDGSSDFTGMTTTDPYLMHLIDGSGYVKYLDAIIPQSLVDGSGNPTLKFRITVGNGSSSDVYETVLGISNIKEQSTGNAINSWEPGKKYVYTLYITKTDIVAVATIKDWVEVNAEENVWF